MDVADAVATAKADAAATVVKTTNAAEVAADIATTKELRVKN